MQQNRYKALDIGLHVFALAALVFTLTKGSAGFNALAAFEPGLASGKWAVRFLLVSLSMTPLRTYFHWNQAARFRKPAGLWSFGFAMVHVIIYFQDVSISWASLIRPYFLALGLFGLSVLAVLAATSNRWVMRNLGKNWKRLHRLVYLAGGAAIIHALLAVSMSKKMYERDPQAVHELRIYLAVLIVLLLVRVPLLRRFLNPLGKRKSVQTSPLPLLDKKMVDPVQISPPVNGNGSAREHSLENLRGESEWVAESGPREKVPS